MIVSVLLAVPVFISKAGNHATVTERRVDISNPEKIYNQLHGTTSNTMSLSSELCFEFD